MQAHEVHNICCRSGWPQPEIEYYTKGSRILKEMTNKDGEDYLLELIDHYGHGLLGNQIVTFTCGHSQIMVKTRIFKQLLKLIKAGEVTFHPNLIYWRGPRV